MGRRRRAAIAAKQGDVPRPRRTAYPDATPVAACEDCGRAMPDTLFPICDECFDLSLPAMADEGLRTYEAYCAREGVQP